MTGPGAYPECKDPRPCILRGSYGRCIPLREVYRYPGECKPSLDDVGRRDRKLSGRRRDEG